MSLLVYCVHPETKLIEICLTPSGSPAGTDRPRPQNQAPPPDQATPACVQIIEVNSINYSAEIMRYMFLLCQTTDKQTLLLLLFTLS